MIISHVKIIAFQLSLFCKNYRFSKTVLYIINRKIHGCLEIPDLFLVLNMISHSFAALTRDISCSTLEINLVAYIRAPMPMGMYYSLFISAHRNNHVCLSAIHKKFREHHAQPSNFYSSFNSSDDIVSSPTKCSVNCHINGIVRESVLLYRVSQKKTLRKLNRLSCITNVAKQFNFYIGRKNSYLAFQ